MSALPECPAARLRLAFRLACIHRGVREEDVTWSSLEIAEWPAGVLHVAGVMRMRAHVQRVTVGFK